MGGHLATAGRGIIGGSDGLLEHLVGRDAEREAESAIAVVRKDPIVTGA